MITKDRIWFRRITSLIVVAVVASAALFTQVRPVQAAAIILEVDTTVDDPLKTACTATLNDCSLRGAISHVMATLTIPAPDYEIHLESNTYPLTTHGTGEDLNQSGDLDVIYNGYLLIVGTGYASSIISGDSADRVIELFWGNLTLQDLSIRYGVLADPADVGGGVFSHNDTTLLLQSVSVDHNTAGFRGGGIYTASGTLQFYTAKIDQNHAQEGAGISTSDTDLSAFQLIITNNIASGDAGGGLLTNGTGSSHLIASYIMGNEADRGGGIFNSDSMTISDSIIKDNHATTRGSGVESWGSFTLERSEVSENDSTGYATLAFEHSFSLSHVTIANNSADGTSAIYISDGVSSTVGDLNHVTITDNTSANGGANIFISTGSLQIQNSIINSTDGNIACAVGVSPAALTSNDFNIASDTSCHLTELNDHPATDPLLRSLGYFGGLNFTAPPLTGSVAIDGADPSLDPSYMDQRMFDMVDGDQNGISVPDIGASEAFPPAVYYPLIFQP